jgi:hypothetical protein
MVFSAQPARRDPLVKLATLALPAKPVTQALWEPMAEMVFSEQRAKWEQPAKLA